MSPRPRKASDPEVFAAAARVIARLGPGRATLADIAGEVGLTAGALVQRFGSKRSLLLALVAQSADASAAAFAALRSAHASPLAALDAVAKRMASMAPTPETLANHLAFLQMDLSDPEFHAHALRQARVVQAATRSLLDDAVAAGELESGCDTDQLARAVQSLMGGSLLSWAIQREGTAEAALRRDLGTLLGSHRCGGPSNDPTTPVAV